MSRLPFAPPLLLVTDRRRFPPPGEGEPLSAAEQRVLDAALRAGVGAVQLREKDLDGRPLYERARDLAARCRAAGAKLAVNDRLDVALAVDADGVHLPANGLPAAVVRPLAGGRWIGASVHSLDELERARSADFVVFGPVYETPSKRAFGPPQGLERLAEIVRQASVPVVAVGGIVPERVAGVIAAGAAGVAVIGAILDADDPAGAVRRFRAALDAACAARGQSFTAR